MIGLLPASSPVVIILETVSPTNVEIYKNYGFEVVEEVKVPNEDLILYAMLRTTKQ